MRALIQRRIRQVESWIDDEADWQQIAEDCRSILRDTERRAVTAGNPAIVELCQARGGGLRHARKVLAACLEALQPETLTPPQIAKQLSVSPDTVGGWIRKGELRASNLNKRGKRPRWVVERSALAEFLKARQPEPPQKRTRRRKPDSDVTEYF